MQHQRPFGEVLEAIDLLSLEEQETLVEIVHRRLAEQGRKRLVAEIQEGKEEFAGGRCSTATVDEIMNEILL